MKNTALIFASLLLLLTAGGCDFFRGIAGRPTSADIEAKRERIERTRERERFVRDSLERAKADSVALAMKTVADSLHAADTLSSIGMLHRASAHVNIPRARLQSRYALVVGVFSSESNAGRLLAKYADAGLDGYVLRYRSGLCAVLVAPCEHLSDALVAYRRVRTLPFGSAQTWVLVNE